MVKGTIFLSGSLITKLGIPQTPQIDIRVGNTVASARLVINGMKRKTYMLSPELAKFLHLGKRKRIQLRYDEESNQIHIGPVIGVLSPSLPNYDIYDPKSLQAELILLSKIGRTLPAYVYVFTPGSIDWRNKTVRGYNYQQISSTRSGWVSSIYPLPDVVYNRVPSRSSEIRPAMRRTIKKLNSLPHLKMFNPSFLNKWKVYEYLSTNPELQAFLPETRMLTTADLEEMLQNYPEVYLKPCNGSLGKGIIKATVKPKGVIRYVVYGNHKIRGTAYSPSDLLKKTRRYRRGKPYIVQQGLNLSTYKGSPFDIRIIFQKNRHGHWQVGKKFVRVAPKGSSISNLSRGGKAEKADKIFSHIYKGKQTIKDKNTEIDNLCHKLAATLENASQLNYGELGMDIGVDKAGHPWLIEVNSKPRKSTRTSFSQAIVRNSFKRPLQYASFLAGFVSP